MSEQFCTYFDHRYAAKGLAMWRSLKAHRPDAVLHVLCMDNICEAVFAAMDLPDVQLHRLAAVEAYDPELLATKGTRSRIEYYFTVTPCFPRYLLAQGLAASRLTYIDADLFFLSNPQPVFDALGERSIGIIEHRFPPAIADREIYGRFNVGWITFRDDAPGRACLDSWRAACVAWCYDRLEGDRFADQKYLDSWPGQFPVAVIDHPGANLAPWNLGRHVVTESGGAPLADGRPVVFFHAHGFRLSGRAHGHHVNLGDYAAEPTVALEQTILTPYEEALRAAVNDLAVPLLVELAAGRQRETAYEQETLREYRAARSYVSTLEEQLGEASAQHRAATDALAAARTEVTVERELVHAERDGLTRRVAELDAALAAQRAELLAETFKVGALTTAAAAEKEARAALEQQWAAARQDAHTASSRLGALEARLEIEAARRADAEAQLASVDRAREEAATALAASRAECQGLSAALEQARQAQAAQATAAAALSAEQEAASAAVRAEAASLATALEQERQASATQGIALSQLTAEKAAALATLEGSRAEAAAMAAIAERERGTRTALEAAVAQATAAKVDAETALAASRAEADARAAMLTEVQATIARLGTEMEAIGRRVGALTAQLNREERQRMDAVRDAGTARADADAARAREQEARSALDQLARELTQTRAQLEEARSNWYHADGNLKVVKGSLSWKVTGPLRVIRDAIIGPAQHG